MATKNKSKKSRSKSRNRQFRLAVLGKPSGVIQPRVQEVGPEHFGIVAVDCAKDRSKWMLCNFYGTFLIPPTVVEHRQNSLKAATQLLDAACREHQIKDLIVCVEMTGTYHQIVFRHFRSAGLDTRIVHPFASSHYRMPEHGDVKTDDHDLAAIFRAAVNGFGLVEKIWPDVYQQLQILVRHRRDLVNKRSKVQCQIRHHLERCLPGFAANFRDNDLWEHPLGVTLLRWIAEHGGTHQAILDVADKSLIKWLKDEGCRFHKKTIDRIYNWASQAASGHEMSPTLSRVWRELLDDWKLKMSQIAAIEVDEAMLLVQTPYILLLSHPGINVISAAELAGETGPIEYYASCKAVSGRAGLFPSRYQSDKTDRAGNLSRFRNGRMRAAWMMVADNMAKCNAYWQRKNCLWKEQGHDARDTRCRIANRLTRTIFQMISGRKLYSHPSRLDRGYVLEKLMVFLQEHKTPPAQIAHAMQAAVAYLPAASFSTEAIPIQEFCQKSIRSRRHEPKALGSLLVAVLAKLGVAEVESKPLEVPTVGSDVDAQ